MSTTLEHRQATGLRARPTVFPVLEINSSKPDNKPERVSWARPYAWSTIIPAVRRQESIEAALIGCALGESIAQLSPSKVSQLTSHQAAYTPPQFVPSHRTEGLLITVQAVLQSQAVSDQFVSSLRQRIGWYRCFQPIAYLRHWMQSFSGANKFTARLGDDPLVRAVALSVLMQGHNDGALNWVMDSTQMSYTSRWVTQASFLIATAAQVAQFQRTKHQTDVSNLLDDLKSATGSKEVEQRLDALIDAKSQNLSVSQASKILGDKDRWQDHLVNNALLAIYAYICFPDNLKNGIGELCKLQGNLRGVLPLYASLATIHSSVAGIPTLWRERLTLYPYSKNWVQQYVDRCADWPHGPEDIQATRCLPSRPIGQLIRNLSRGFC